MEHTQCRVQKRGQRKKDSLSEASQLKKLAKGGISHQATFVNIIQSQNSNVFPKYLFFLLVHGHYKIPKLMASADEMYLRHCLESVHNSALKASQHKKSVSLEANNLWTSEKSLNTDKFIGEAECDSSELVLGHSVASITENLVVSTNASDNWTLGTVMGTKSMINILNSPLLRQVGVSERDDNLNSMNFTDAKNMICYGFMDSPSSSYKLEMEKPMVQSHKYGSISVSQGMLQCTWKQGVPHFVFSADDQKEVYVAKLSKADTTHYADLDYVYLFHLNKGREIPDRDLQLVGKMNVSTCYTLSPDNCRVMETRFILFGNDKFYDKEMYTSRRSHMKNKGMAKKASRSSPSPIHRTLSKFSRSKAIRESCPLDKQSCGLDGTNLIETNVPTNFELAAILVKDHLLSHSLDKVGGWGLKFLNKSGVNHTTLPSESCNQNTRDCSSSISILVPAGLHGGPRTTHGGPSSLVDRWKSGGCCDCGGWDEGCPLTVLQRRTINEEILSHVDTQGECKSVDLVTQGSSNFSPTLRMVNVHDGLYFIDFQPSLSALQSFSIAVAIIHTQSPTLRPNSTQEL
ncbi:uncharacterized protein LOC114402776 [Glycine soja]|uniref:Uncharacterized protein n=1 Tax=Glycine soja TaxID=3848 RepID=A0A0B2QTB8_GLYSO|nr:uncharacterized protein LOC114402776 [Glycine soja]KHN24881.1 hypothetical protein glysoja_028727 [Glycine soja]RZB42972.1 hypothetical protein D0Y65_053539 [Glycine soja]